MSNKNKEWFENDKFWKDIRKFLFPEELWNRASEEVSKIIKLLEMKSSENVLDLCCGPGRHTLEFSARGFSVTGVDRTRAYLTEARKKAKEMDVNPEFIQEDMRKFLKPESFDTVLNLYTSFGYFEDPEDDRKVVYNIYQSLKKGGKLLMEMMGKEILAGIYKKRDWNEADNMFLLEERIIDDNWAGINNRWILIKKRKRSEFNFYLRLYSGTEISKLLKNSGFNSVRLFSDLEGSPYNNNARRLIAVAEK